MDALADDSACGRVVEMWTVEKTEELMHKEHMK